jgi:hypothetical protein
VLESIQSENQLIPIEPPISVEEESKTQNLNYQENLENKWKLLDPKIAEKIQQQRVLVIEDNIIHITLLTE